MAVAAFFGPEKAVDGAVLNTIHVRNDGGPVQRGDPVVHSVDEKQGPGILRAVNGLLPQRPAPEAQKLVQIEEGIVQEGEAAEIVVNAGDRRFHGAVDASHADCRVRMALRKNAAHGVAAHTVTEEKKMPASEKIILSEKTQCGPQIVECLREPAAGASLTFITARIVEGEHTPAGVQEVADLRTVMAGAVAKTGGHDHQTLAFTEEVSLQFFPAAVKCKPAAGTAEVLLLFRVKPAEAAMINNDRDQQEQNHTARPFPFSMSAMGEFHPCKIVCLWYNCCIPA